MRKIKDFNNEISLYSPHKVLYPTNEGVIIRITYFRKRLVRNTLLETPPTVTEGWAEFDYDLYHGLCHIRVPRPPFFDRLGYQHPLLYHVLEIICKLFEISPSNTQFQSNSTFNFLNKVQCVRVDNTLQNLATRKEVEVCKKTDEANIKRDLAESGVEIEKEITTVIQSEETVDESTMVTQEDTIFDKDIDIKQIFHNSFEKLMKEINDSDIRWESNQPILNKTVKKSVGSTEKGPRNMKK